MKKSLILTSVMIAGLLATSCSSEEMAVSQPTAPGSALTFKISLPVTEKVNYTKAEIHDVSEYTINSLALYEYEVGDDSEETLVRVLRSGGNAGQMIDLGNKKSDNSYEFSIIVPAENLGKKYTYRFIANDAATHEVGTPFSGFSATPATLTLSSEDTADRMAENGIAMSGVARENNSEVITMAENLKCDVAMTRIVSRIDIKYQTPNLKVTAVELRNAPTLGTLFPQSELPAFENDACITLGANANTPMPTDYLKNIEDKDTEELQKAFYLYERKNEEGKSAVVHIEYEIDANDKEQPYHGYVDVEFKKADGTYVDAVRNNLYTIVLGNGKEPVVGKVHFTVNVTDWTPVELEDYLTSDDETIE